MGLEVKEKGDSGGVRGRPSLWKSVKVFFRGISRKQGTVRGSGSDKTPRGLENMPGPEPTWAKIGDKCAPVLLIFYPSASFPFVCLSQALISVQSTSLFLSVAHSFLFVALLFFFSFPFSFVCCVSAPPVSHYTNPIYEADKHMPTHCVSMRASLFFLPPSLPLLSSAFAL